MRKICKHKWITKSISGTDWLEECGKCLTLRYVPIVDENGVLAKDWQEVRSRCSFRCLDSGEERQTCGCYSGLMQEADERKGVVNAKTRS
jgi:hypothetical protein